MKRLMNLTIVKLGALFIKRHSRRVKKTRHRIEKIFEVPVTENVHIQSILSFKKILPINKKDKQLKRKMAKRMRTDTSDSSKQRSRMAGIAHDKYSLTRNQRKAQTGRANTCPSSACPARHMGMLTTAWPAKPETGN